MEAGESDLTTLLSQMDPLLREPEYVFCALPHGAKVPAGVIPFATVHEDEALTIVVPAGAVRDVPRSAPFRAITLRVHSSLDAVGFIAAVARALADEGIAANVVAGTYHDHVFVPARRAGDAMRVLETLRVSACRRGDS